MLLPVLPLAVVPVHAAGGGYVLGLVATAASAPVEVASLAVLLVVRPFSFVDVPCNVRVRTLVAPAGEGSVARKRQAPLSFAWEARTNVRSRSSSACFPGSLQSATCMWNTWSDHLSTHHAVFPSALKPIAILELLRSVTAPQARFPRTRVHVPVLVVASSWGERKGRKQDFGGRILPPEYPLPEHEFHVKASTTST